MNRIYAGDTLEFGVNVPDFPPDDDWDLKMRLAPRFTSPVQTPITITAVTDTPIAGQTFDYTIQVPPSTTAEWVPGAYSWHSWVEKDGARVTLEGTQYQGEVTVLPDPSTLDQGADTRSTARKALDEAKAALATFAATNGKVKSYSIAGRSMEFESAVDVAKLVTFWQQEVDREQEAERRDKGLPSKRKAWVRF